MKSTDTALLGHTSGDALSAAALSDLYTMCTAVLIQGRVLGILVGQTSGAVKYLPSSSLWSTGGTTYTRCIQELGLDMPSSQYFTRG